MRSNPEDFLVLIDVLNKNPHLSSQIDLRDEIKALPVVSASETPSAAATQTDKKSGLSQVVGVLRSPFLCFKASDTNHTISLDEYKCSWTSDGQNLYYASSDSKLIKFSIPKLPNETLYFKEYVDSDLADKSSICYLDGKLFVRNPGA